MDYYELIIEIVPRDPWSEILVAELAEGGFESFIETDEGIIAYAPISEIDADNPFKDTFLESYVNGSKDKFDLHVNWSMNVIPKQNWNEVWEKDFHPVHVGDLVTIYAPFHDPSCIKGLGVEILPKMSFGTGHHQTTYLMSKALFGLTNFPINVLDMGTGTGVLAIIAEKLGAKQVLAVDIEPWSVENTVENAARNNCKNILVKCGDVDVLGEEIFDLILANINKNVLKSHLPYYSERLTKGGVLLISGFFTTDIDELLFVAKKCNFKLSAQESLESWALLKFIKN
jgi:ribosomal protein L11 methyltransferase